MQKLLQTLNFSSLVRQNIFDLDELLNYATAHSDVLQVNRRIRYFQDELNIRRRQKNGWWSKIELYALQKELNRLRRKVASLTVKFLNEAA